MVFTFVDKQRELVISVPTSCAADSIRGNTIHTTLEIITRVEKDFVIKVNMLWLQRSSLIIDEVSIIDLKLLTSIDRQLPKVKRSDISSISIIGSYF